MEDPFAYVPKGVPADQWPPYYQAPSQPAVEPKHADPIKLSSLILVGLVLVAGVLIPDPRTKSLGFAIMIVSQIFQMIQLQRLKQQLKSAESFATVLCRKEKYLPLWLVPVVLPLLWAILFTQENNWLLRTVIAACCLLFLIAIETEVNKHRLSGVTDCLTATHKELKTIFIWTYAAVGSVFIALGIFAFTHK